MSDLQMVEIWSNSHMWRIGDICRKAADDPNCGDYIDRGLILMNALKEAGYAIVVIEKAIK